MVIYKLLDMRYWVKRERRRKEEGLERFEKWSGATLISPSLLYIYIE